MSSAHAGIKQKEESTTMRSGFRKRGLYAVGLLSVAGPAFAGGSVDIGHGVSADWNLKAIAGSAIRTQSPSNDILFAGNKAGGRSNDAVSDDGDLNYNKGDFVKGSAQLYGSVKLSRGNYGIFVSGQAWEDYLEDNKSVAHGNVPNGYAPNTPLSDNGFNRRAKFNGATFQQAYAFGKFDVRGHDVSFKLGKQLLLWGRSLFTRGSFGSLNAIDLPAFHRPGSEYEQYLIPSGSLSADVGLTKHLDMKAFYQFDWQHSVTDGCGTFYATYDNVAPGCYATFSNQVVVPNRVALEQGLYFRRGPDNKASNGGQYGFKLDYSFAQQNAHVGAYFFNYNARLPYYSLHKNADPRPTASAPSVFNSITFHYDYPNDIRVFGLTADKTFQNIGNLALNLSYIDNMPLQINTPDLTTQSATSATGEPANPNIPAGTQAYVDSRGLGQDVQGYKRYGVERAELTFTTIIPDLLGADKTVASAETAFETIPNLPNHNDIRFGRHTNFGVGAPDAGGYVTDFSWGYQISVESTYKNAIGPVTLKPSLTLRQGVDGYSSDNSFEAHQRTITAGLGLQYHHLGGDLSYTNYNTTKYSTVQDRDYFAFSASYSF
ncbi:DUF1302 domain-containing protein [Salinisphaera hydrothermalis]|nr:DUF1302 domain-containing protein [Salinisphaera hydrothermalis]